MQRQKLSNTTNKTTIIQWVLLILAFILSIVGIIIGLSSNKSSSGDSNVCPTDELVDLSNTVSSLKDTVENKCVYYNDDIQLQSTGTDQDGFLTNDEDGSAMFKRCHDEVQGETLSFKVYRNLKGCAPN